MPSCRIGKKGFLAEYSLEDTYLLNPERSHGRAGILRGRNRSSIDVLIKHLTQRNSTAPKVSCCIRSR